MASSTPNSAVRARAAAESGAARPENLVNYAVGDALRWIWRSILAVVSWLGRARWFAVGLLAVVVMLVGCGSSDLTGGSETPRPLFGAELGGASTHGASGADAFNTAAPGLTDEQDQLFDLGRRFFEAEWVLTPTSSDDAIGLGPVFNGVSCASCHVLGGRGNTAPASGDLQVGITLRLAGAGLDPATGGPEPDPVYGSQIQDQSVDGVPAEASVDVAYEIVAGTYGDGEPFELSRPVFELTDLAFGPLADDVVVSGRLAPPVFGIGLLEAIPAADILEAADPDDADGDGISGRPNLIVDAMSGNEMLGRFSWKASVATVQQQVAVAFHTDIGVTTYFHLAENCTANQTDCQVLASSGRPELSDGLLGSVTFFNRTLGVPAMRDAEDDEVVRGAQLFESMGCASCHTPAQRTGQTEVGVLTTQEIFPYTDLLLHDMGPDLADGRTEFEAGPSEWRTPPLWGLGRTAGVLDAVNGSENGGRFNLLHDGRARTIPEAILWHGGEAEASREAFRTAPVEDRSALVRFLTAL